METLHHRLEALGPAIEALMTLGGAPGLSLSVVTKATTDQPVVYHTNYGFRDREQQLPVTEKTLFSAGSLAKAMSAAALGILVEEGAATWDTLAKDAVPSFQSQDAVLQNETTITDLLSHRSGMSSCGHLVGGCEANVLIRRADVMPVVNSQVLLPERRGAFSYNSTAYDLVGEAIESLSGSPSVDAFCRTRIFAPLGMSRTFMNPPPPSVVAETDNVAACYNALDDGSSARIPGPKIGEDGVGAASGGLWSCAADLVKLYIAFLRSYTHQTATGQTATPGSPFKHVASMTAAQVPMAATIAQTDLAYCMGWVRVQLPSVLGHIGLNGRLMPQGRPVVGNGVPGQHILYHQGTLPGTLASVVLLPDSDSLLVVLGNALALTDVPDWVAQMVVQEILDVPAAERIDFHKSAEATVAINLEWYPRVVQGLADARPDTTKAQKSPEAYIGTYVDETGIFQNVVRLDSNGILSWSFQGLPSETFALTHYDGDTFTWLPPSRNELSRRGRWVLGDDCDPAYWKITFGEDGEGTVQTLAWQHDPALRPIVYNRRSESVPEHRSI